jgi:Tol biopolymer transport system component
MRRVPMAVLLLVALLVPAGVAGATQVVDVSLVSRGDPSVPINGSSYEPVVSADGSIIVYWSEASNLVAGDTNGRADVFAYDVATGTTTRLSVGVGGSESDGDSSAPAISADGSTIVYESDATNLVPGDSNGLGDVFAYDVASGTTTLISVATGGTQGDGPSFWAGVSGDGSTIVYQSQATNLVAGDTNGVADVFAYDVASGTTTRVSVATGGSEGDNNSYNPAISADGSTIAYYSQATNLVAGDTNGVNDIFAYDVASGTTTRVSVATGGGQSDGDSFYPVVSADGSTIAYDSRATNLVAGDSNGFDNVYAYDVATGTTTRVSVVGGGVQPNGASFNPGISADGSTIVYESRATNLLSGDTNGVADIFSYDVGSGTTSLVSVAPGGAQADGNSYTPAISGDGSTIVYQSEATNLTSDDSNGQADVFASDAATGTTARVSIAAGGIQANSFSFGPSVSADGATVVFESAASNLVAGDNNSVADIFAFDVASGTTTRVSVATGGTEGNKRSINPAISADGSTIVYQSYASNLVAGDTNGSADVFAYDVGSGTTTRVSVATGGTEGNDGSHDPAVSADGSIIVYWSTASNLVAGDTNGAEDVFAYDAASATTTRVSVGPGGAEGNGGSYAPSVTADGGTIAFQSDASNLVVGDTNADSDVFAYNVASGTTARVSVGPGGAEGNGTSGNETVSADGSTVVYESGASNLVAGDTNGAKDVFAYDVASGMTTRVSVSTDGAQANGASGAPVVSGDGAIVVFASDASNLVSGDTNATSDVFAHDAVTGTTTRVSVGPGGAEGDGHSGEAGITPDGSIIVFTSQATNLVSGDHNGSNDAFLARMSRPPVAEDLTITVPEDTAVGALVGTVTASDPEGKPLSFAITAGNSAGRFSIDSSGKLTLAGVLDYATATKYVLTVTVANGQLSDEATVTVNVGEVAGSGYDPFTDDNGSVFENDIEWLALHGVTKGCNPPANTRFCPNDYVTRGQMAAFLVRALGYTDNGGGDKFSDDNGSIFEDAIDKLATAGVTKGCNPPANTRFCPNEHVSRGQMAAFLHRALG